jgi:hypothetical protein
VEKLNSTVMVTLDHDDGNGLAEGGLVDIPPGPVARWSTAPTALLPLIIRIGSVERLEKHY